MKKKKNLIYDWAGKLDFIKVSIDLNILPIYIFKEIYFILPK